MRECRFVAGEIGGRAVAPEAHLIAPAAEGRRADHRRLCLPLATDAWRWERAGDAAALLLRSGRYRRAGRLRAPAPRLGRRRPRSRGLDALIPFGDLRSVLEASEFLSDAPDAAGARLQRGLTAPTCRPDKRDERPRTARLCLADARRDLPPVPPATRSPTSPASSPAAGIDPARWRRRRRPAATGARRGAVHDDVELEALAELEHERWMAQRRMDGWRSTDAPQKDQAARRHPSLAPTTPSRRR